MKINLYYCLVFAGIFALLTSCSDSYLQVTPNGQSFESGYYKTSDEVFSGLAATYSNLSVGVGYGQGWWCSRLGALNSAADECYTGGGGAGDVTSWQVWNNYTLSAAVGPQLQFWSMDYA